MSRRMKLARFLFQYRITPHATTGETPAKLLMGRQLRSHLSLLHPDLERKVANAQERQKRQYDKNAHERNFETGDPVLARNYSGQNRWIPGTVLERTGPVSARVQIGDTVVRRHNDQLRQSIAAPQTPQNGNSTEVSDPDPATMDLPTVAETPPPVPVETGRRYPARVHKAPTRFKDYNVS